MVWNGFLLIATQQRLLAIDVTKLEILHYSDTEFPTPALPILKVFNFVEEGYSFGASFFKWESKLYMVGGEKTRPGASEEELCMPCGAGFHLESTVSKRSRDIFVSDLTSLESISEFRKHNLVMSTGKPSPIVVEIQGKLYVLSGPSWHYEHSLETPTFEVYDPSLGQFKSLADPPFYISSDYNSYHWVVTGYSVVQASINVLVDDYCYCYRIQDNEWGNMQYSMDEIRVQKSVLPGFSGQLVPAYDDIFICFRFHSLVAVMLRSDGGRPFQYIDEVFDPYYRPDSFSYKGIVVAIGEHEMCIVKPALAEGEDRDRSVLYVATFHVKKLVSSVQDRKRALTCAESSSAPARKLAKMTADSDTGTSHHDRDVRGSDDSEPVQESDLPEPPPLTPRRFVSITCLSKGFYDLEAWGRETPTISSAFFHQCE